MPRFDGRAAHENTLSFEFFSHLAALPSLARLVATHSPPGAVARGTVGKLFAGRSAGQYV